MSHHHSHSHAHDHHHHFEKMGTRFALGVAINVLYIIIEGGYGFLTGSLSLIADAGHNLGDVLALLTSWFALYLCTLRPGGNKTYGYRRSSILAALFNSALLLVAAALIAAEAVQRFFTPQAVPGTEIMIVAGIGIILNFATAMLFYRDKEHDLNIKGAYLHMMADALVSVSVVAGGFIIYTWNIYILDPVISLVIVAVIVYNTWGVLRDSLNLAMDFVPGKINLTEVRGFLLSINGVKELHDLHIWAMSTTETALTVHLIMPDSEPDDKLLSDICSDLKRLFGISHSTIQIEKGSQAHPCSLNTAGSH
ncbi:MAG: cation diffusion facilitator family transporter [Ignavibacteriaceae bacterium]|nr:cation diffusion facilitator family transporter [Ignavibacteriaceae bacterium]